MAGISNDYYIRLERGKETRPSPEVIDALARALRMEPAEHEHLRSLAALAARRVSEAPPAPSHAASHGVRILLDSIRPNPAHVVARNGDLLAWNPGGLALFADLADWPLTQRNVWRYTSCTPEHGVCSTTGRANSASASRICGPCLASSRTHPIWPRSSASWSSKALNSPAFGAATTSTANPRGHKTFHHPEVGDLTLGYQSMTLNGTPGQALVAYYAEPGTPEHDAITLLDRSDADHTSVLDS